MKLLVMITFLTAVLTGCGGASGGNTAANNSNSKNANTANVSNSSSSSETNTNADASRDMTPLALNVSDMVEGSGESQNVGRMATVTGGVLDKISYDSLLIRQPGGRAFYCYGDFGDYTSMASKIESLSAQGKAPRATVKGIYKIASVGSGGELSPCFLTDLDK